MANSALQQLPPFATQHLRRSAFPHLRYSAGPSFRRCASSRLCTSAVGHTGGGANAEQVGLNDDTPWEQVGLDNRVRAKQVGLDGGAHAKQAGPDNGAHTKQMGLHDDAPREPAGLDYGVCAEQVGPGGGAQRVFTMMPPGNRWAFTVMTISRVWTLVPCFDTPNPGRLLWFHSHGRIVHLCHIVSDKLDLFNPKLHTVVHVYEQLG